MTIAVILITLCGASLGWGCEPAALTQVSPGDAPVRASDPSQAQAPFKARRERPIGGKPEGLCAGDFDGDGIADLAAAWISPGKLSIWRGGEFGLGREFSLRDCGGFPLAPVALPPGTFGAAGRAQALGVASRSARTLEILADTARLLELEHKPRALAAGAIDGRAVIAVACDNRRMEVLRDGGAAPERWTLGGELPRCALVSSDLSAVLVGFHDTSTVVAYGASEGPPLGTIRLTGFPRALAALDVDGDGDEELAVAGGDHELWVFGIGEAGGARAWFAGVEPQSWRTDAIPLALDVADFDGDGRDDLAILHHYHLTAMLMTQLSAAGPGRISKLYAGQTPSGFAVLDSNGDGMLDLAIANRDTQGIGFLPGDGAGGFSSDVRIPLGDSPNALAAAPNSAGELRLVALNAKSNTLSAVVFREGVLKALESVPSGSEARSPRILEWDGAPGLDALCLITGARGAELMRFSGDSTGRLVPGTALELGGAASDLLLVDVDGDGSAELALCDPIAGTAMLLEATVARGDVGSLSRTARLPVPASPNSLCRIELDGDAAPEIACVLAAPGARVGIAWLDAQRTAAGNLELVELGFSAVPGAPVAAVSCDLNGDGRADLAVLTTAGPGSAQGAWYGLLRGPGGPNDFSLSAPFATGLRPNRIAAADLDADGRAEVFVAAQNSHLVNAWTPIGAKGALAGGLEVRAWDDLGAGLGPLDLCVSDVDGDGRLDLCVVNGFSNDLSLLYGSAPRKAQSNSTGR